jgi:hypothetical protein
MLKNNGIIASFHACIWPKLGIFEAIDVKNYERSKRPKI